MTSSRPHRLPRPASVIPPRRGFRTRRLRDDTGIVLIGNGAAAFAPDSSPPHTDGTDRNSTEAVVPRLPISVPRCHHANHPHLSRPQPPLCSLPAAATSVAPPLNLTGLCGLNEVAVTTPTPQ